MYCRYLGQVPDIAAEFTAQPCILEPDIRIDGFVNPGKFGADLVDRGIDARHTGAYSSSEATSTVIGMPTMMYQQADHDNDS